MPMPSPWLEIRRIPSDPETLRSWVTEDEWLTASGKCEARRIEWLAWRALAREKLGRGTRITYDANGAPELEKGKGSLSVSHTKGWIAVAWSPERCAVDIEKVSRNVSGVSARFISEEEKLLSDSAIPLFPISIWCAKEALYKYARIAGLDFLSDIRIISSDIASGSMTGTVKPGRTIDIGLLYRDGLVAAYIF